MKLINFFAAILIVGIVAVNATVPSEELRYRDLPKCALLSNVDPSVPLAFSEQQENLSSFELKELSDFGHYFSGCRELSADMVASGVTGAQLNFTDETLDISSIGNATATINATNVLEINGTLVFM